ncbi:NAC protein [Rhizoctonia solani]|uniref:Nascent polypeptide-associated complex subunit beta n=1 Tax=Rhizoctonia solani TaxID=456999 RepID=A0A8H7M4C7_9AGAM|nr:NAC protein [Rhizoctonia solani]
MNAEKLAKLQAAAAANRIGGKGSVRRKVVPRSGPKAAGGDDKKLAAALKKLNVQPIAPIEEVNMFQVEERLALYRSQRYVNLHGAHSSNTFAVYGAGHVKDLTELVPVSSTSSGPTLWPTSEDSPILSIYAGEGASRPRAALPEPTTTMRCSLIGTERLRSPRGDKPADAAEPAATEPAATEPAATEPAAEATTEATKANDVD